MDASFPLFSLCLFFLLFRYLCFYVLYALFIAFFGSLCFSVLYLFSSAIFLLYIFGFLFYISFPLPFSEDRLRQAQGKKGVRQIWAGGRAQKGPEEGWEATEVGSKQRPCHIPARWSRVSPEQCHRDTAWFTRSRPLGGQHGKDFLAPKKVYVFRAPQPAQGTSTKNLLTRRLHRRGVQPQKKEWGDIKQDEGITSEHLFLERAAGHIRTSCFGMDRM